MWYNGFRMAEDKYTATWVSHSSISDFLSCPRAYYLKHIYRDPKTGHKIKITSPPLSLGQIVHEVLESLSILPVEERFTISLVEKFNLLWSRVSGKKGGFLSEDAEQQYKKKGEEMLQRVMEHPGPLARLAVKIKMNLPYYFLSKEDNIILCGKLDWLEYVEKTDSVHIVDFKTSKTDEEEGSLQLPIYCLLAQHCQTKQVSGVSYWYLARNSNLTSVKLPDLPVEEKRILEIAKKIKLARKLNVFKCPNKTGCHECRPFEAILRGEGELVGTGTFREDVYIVESTNPQKEKSMIL